MLEEILRGACGLTPSLPVVAGVSGGPDSLCLLHILHTAGYPVIVAHFNHKLRPEADQEAADVARQAHDLGLPFVIDAADVRSLAQEHSLSLEEAARLLRYRFLFSTARQYHAQAVAVGHTADDQVETVLMHFLRGAGLAGLKGMQYRSFLPAFDAEIPLVRPLLALWRTEIEAYCREHALTPHYDSSNADQTYFRNRLRHALIPELEQYNPTFKQVVLRMTEALQGDYTILQEVMQAAWGEVLLSEGPGWVALDREKLLRQSIALRRNLLRQAGQRLRPNHRDFGFAVLERGAAFLENPGNRRLDFAGGLYLFAEGRQMYVATYEADLPFAQWPQIQAPVEVQGERCDLGEGWVLSVEQGQSDDEAWKDNLDVWSAWLDADLTGDRLTVRGRREGERFQPLGMAEGTLKLSDFFVNVKLPRRARAKWPLVCAGEEIAWIPGYRIGHRFRVTMQTRRVWKLSLRKL